MGDRTRNKSTGTRVAGGVTPRKLNNIALPTTKKELAGMIAGSENEPELVERYQDILNKIEAARRREMYLRRISLAPKPKVREVSANIRGLNNIKLSFLPKRDDEIVAKYSQLAEKYCVTSPSFAMEAQVIKDDRGNVVELRDVETGKPFYELSSEEEAEYNRYMLLQSEGIVSPPVEKPISKSQGNNEKSLNRVEIRPSREAAERRSYDIRAFNGLNRKQQDIFLKFRHLEQNYELRQNNECIIGNVQLDPATGRPQAVYDNITGKEIYILSDSEQREYEIYTTLMAL